MNPKRILRGLRHPISQNVIALYWLQFATFVVPILTLPYVARVLHPSTFGLVVFSQGFAFVLMVMIDWGFTYDGVRASAEARDDPVALAAVAHRIRGAQLLLVLASIPIALGALVVVPKLSAHPAYLVFAWIAAVTGGLAPSWFFIGIEQMRLISLVSLGFRVIGAALTFTFVKGPAQGWIVMALFAGSAAASLVALDIMMYRRVGLRAPPLRASFLAVRGAATLFVGTVAATLYTSFNVVLLGLFEPSASVAHFGAAERVLRVSLQVLAPIGTAVYPRLAALQASERHDRARQLLRITVGAVTIVGLGLAGFLALLAPIIIRVIYGAPYVHASVPILRVLVLIIPIAIIGAVAGSWLMTLHMDRKVVMIVIRAGILNVVLGCILTPMIGPIGMAWSVLSAEATAAIGGVYAVLRTERAGTVPLLARSG